MIIKLNKKQTKELKERYEGYKWWCVCRNIRYVKFREWVLR